MTTNVKTWIRGLVATGVNGFASGVVLIVADPVAFNLQDGLGKLMATSAVFALFGLANYLKQHPLPDDEGTVTPRMWVILPIIFAAGVAFNACATAPVVVNPNDAQVQATRAKAVEIAAAVESAGSLVVQVTRTAIAAADAGVLTRAQRDVVLEAVIALEPRAIAAIDIAKAVTSEPELRATVAQLLAVFDPLVSMLASSGSTELARLGEALRLAYRVATVYMGGDR